MQKKEKQIKDRLRKLSAASTRAPGPHDTVAAAAAAAAVAAAAAAGVFRYFLFVWILLYECCSSRKFRGW